MIRVVCERFGLRPSDLLDEYRDLSLMERIYLDILVATARSEEGSKTVSGAELEAHLARVEEMRRRGLLK